MKATLTVLGSGTSMGVPTIGCDCAVCHSADPHDRRTRPSVLIEYNGKVVMIDSTPDFREQALREQIRQLDAAWPRRSAAAQLSSQAQQASVVCASESHAGHPQHVPLHL
jgi:phosphoribosyl 1,2-cyclic phosphate phosphodiesterase